MSRTTNAQRALLESAQHETLSLKELLDYLATTDDDVDAWFPAFTLAWRLRTFAESDILAAPPSEVLALEVPERHKRIIAEVQLQYFRIEFRHQKLEELAERYYSRWPESALMKVMYGFALAGQDAGGERGPRLMLEAVEARPNHMTTVLVAMLGLRVNAYDHAEAMDHISAALTRNPARLCAREVMNGPTLLFHRAQAMRVLAEKVSPSERELALHHLADAEASIGSAIENLKRGATTVGVHQDFVREREQVMETRTRLQRRWAHREQDAQELETKLKKHLYELDREVVKSREQVDGSMVRVVEVLAVFVALVGFVIGGGAFALGPLPESLEWSEIAKRAGVLFGFGAGALCFFVALRLIVRSGSPLVGKTAQN